MPTNMSNVDQMLSFLEPTPEPGASTKTASAPVDASAAPAAPAAAPAASSVATAAAKIASAEEEQMKTTAAAFGTEFAKAAEAHFKSVGIDFAKVGSAPGAGGGDINQAAVDAAFKAGMLKGAEDTVAAFRQGYADRLKVAHDLLTTTHMSGQAHGAALRKHASDVAAKQKLVDAGQIKQADAEVQIADVLPFWQPEKPATAA